MSVVEIIRLPLGSANPQLLADVVYSGRTTYLAPPRCASLDVLVGDRELVVLAEWESQAAHDEAAGEPTSKDFLNAVAQLAAGPPVVGFYSRAGMEPPSADARMRP